MELELLKALYEVHRPRHFWKTGDNLYYPSAVSARNQYLEDQLGVKLFTPHTQQHSYENRRGTVT